VVVRRAWRPLHASHFPELPLDCGNTNDPGIIFSEDLRDWSDKATTPDQYRIEQYIDRFDLRDKRVLHIGIGNSGLARRFHRRVKEIVGTTIDEPEMKVARSLDFPNYTSILHNKYSGEHGIVPGRFDFIVDNNPTSPCCCFRHLAELFDFYAEKLADGGQVVTDRQGLAWVPVNSDPRWSFDFADLAAVAEAAGFSAFRANGKVYVLSRSPTTSPGYLALSRHLWRRTKKFPGQIVRHGPRLIARYFRQSIKWLLLSTVPWALPTRYRPGK
jgi:hypothetical protein